MTGTFPVTPQGISTCTSVGWVSIYLHVTQLTIMFIVSVNECAHAVVPQLDDSIVQTGQDPWPRRMERQT